MHRNSALLYKRTEHQQPSHPVNHIIKADVISTDWREQLDDIMQFIILIPCH